MLHGHVVMNGNEKKQKPSNKDPHLHGLQFSFCLHCHSPSKHTLYNNNNKRKQRQSIHAHFIHEKNTPKEIEKMKQIHWEY